LNISKTCVVFIATLSCALLVLLGNAGLAKDAIAPIRPPAVPLIVRNPYVSVWQPADKLVGSWAAFWTGDPEPMTGIARIDNKSYVFMGAPAHVGSALAQERLQVTATQSIYTFADAGVRLTLDFLSPVEANDLRRLSMPFGYISATARSTDGKKHDVHLYFDFAGQWATNDPAMPIRWKTERVLAGRSQLFGFAVSPAAPDLLNEHSDQPQWGTFVVLTEHSRSVMYEAGPDSIVHAEAKKRGSLSNNVDAQMPRVVGTDTPVFAFDVFLKAVGATVKPPVVLLVGFVRDPAVSYLSQPLPPLWKSYWNNWQQMAAFAYGDFAAARNRANQEDRQILMDAQRVGGAKYAALCALALRQTFGATELVGTAAKPWMFMKEISSDGNVSTVDVVYPAFPAFLYTNPQLVSLLLDPLFEYAEHGGWPKAFAEHDIGTSYPNAAGHNNGKEEDMPVEESANMLLMTGAYLRRVPSTEARRYASLHYTILKRWADYELAHSVNPEYQNQTDDFTGFIKSSANLALKGILSVGAMGQIAQAAGNTQDAVHYSAAAREMIARWQDLAQSKTGDHLVLAYGQDATWSLKYNAFPDKLLELGLLPRSILDEEASYYIARANQFGVPLDNRHTYTKADWELWVAAATDDEKLRNELIDRVYAFANQSSSRVAFSDWYDTVTGRSNGFMARPVMGATFALLVTNKTTTQHLSP